MFRLCVTQNATFASRTVLQSSIRRKSTVIKRKGKIKASNKASTSKETSESSYEAVLEAHKNCAVHEQSVKEETSSTLPSEPKVNRFKIMENLNSFSIFGSETTEDNGIQCIESNTNPSIPSVTNILNETMSAKAKAALELWKKNIIDKYGEDYFKVLCKGLLDDGKQFHTCIKNVLSHKEAEVPPRIKSAYFSVEPILNDIKTVHALETYVTHPTLRYKGIVDCVASYRDQLYVIDWKKSGKQKASLAATFDAPVQIAAYIGAINASKKYSFRIDKGLVVVAYTTGESATVHELNKDALQKAWGEWLRRLEEFYTKLNNTV